MYVGQKITYYKNRHLTAQYYCISDDNQHRTVNN